MRVVVAKTEGLLGIYIYSIRVPIDMLHLDLDLAAATVLVDA